MRIVSLSDLSSTPPELKIRAILEVVVSQAQDGANVAEVRRRMRVLDAFAAASAADEVLLEDADHDTLSHCLSGFKFAQANVYVMAAISAVENAAVR